MLQIFRRCICKSKKSATRMHLVQNPRVPMLSPATQMQHQKICNADALLVPKTCMETPGTCLEIPESCLKTPVQATYAWIQGTRKKPIPSNLNRHMHAHTLPLNRKELLCHLTLSHKKELTNTQDECLCFCRPSCRLQL